MTRKKGVYFKWNEKACQSAFEVGGRSPTEIKSRQGEKMYQLKLLIVMGLFVMALSVGCLTACTTKYQKITKPDGTTIEFWDFEFHPNLLPNLLNYEVQYFGLSEQGLPIQKMIPKNGGQILYEMQGGYYSDPNQGSGPKLNRLEVDSQTDPDESDSFQASEYRISADYLADSAVLEGQIVGTDNWQVIVNGDLETVAIAAMRRGLGVMEFENEFGAWSIQVDSPLPAIVTRLNGEIINVSGVRASGKPTLDTTLNERCR